MQPDIEMHTSAYVSCTRQTSEVFIQFFAATVNLKVLSVQKQFGVSILALVG